MDDEGYFFITGRMKRFLKLYGLRVNLDELEAALFGELGEVVACHGIDDQLLILVENAARRHDVEQLLVLRYAINPNGFRVITGQPIPRTAAGKIDYPSILAAHLAP
jgi:acyl-coenzyme A synthetase/AMP-(fatty) acid ligase